jgi:hypothetical protein
MVTRTARALIVLTVILMALMAAPAVAAPADVRRDADWLLAQQRPSGAILRAQGDDWIETYPAHHAAWGLARATRFTGDRRYAEAAYRWFRWYAARQDGTGYVWDHRVSGGVEVRTTELDSTDASNAAYLLAVHEWWRATGDRTGLDRLKKSITKAVKAIDSTRQPDGLTWAKPDWHVKYLMDNAEAVAGLHAAAVLARVFGNAKLAKRAGRSADLTRRGLETLWNPGRASYDWALHGNGYRELNRWEILYPDATQQAWAVAFAITDATRSRHLVTTLAAHHPNWDRPESRTLFRLGDGSVADHAVEYWPIIGWGYLRIGDTARAATAATNIRAAMERAGRRWPLTTGVVGQLIHLELGGPQLPTG